MRCCILGGQGFIGTNLTNFLVGAGWTVRVFGRSQPLFTAKDCVEVVTGEFSNPIAVKQAIDNCDTVFHLIGATNPVTAENDRIGDLRQNVESTLRLLDLGVSGAFRQIVFLSSGGTVYGVQDATPIQEDSQQWPISTYGVTKVTIERYLHLYNHLHGLDVRIARVSNPFGENQNARKGQGVVAALVDCALSGRDFQMVGDGSVVRDFIYVGDVVEALHALTTYRGRYQVFNIASGVGRSLTQMIELVEDATNRKIGIFRLPSRPMDVAVNVLDIHRAADELGWAPRTSVRTALQRTVAWAKHAHLSA